MQIPPKMKREVRRRWMQLCPRLLLHPQHPPPSLVAPKVISSMAYVSRRAAPKKQQSLSIVDHLRELSETNDDKDGLVFRKHKAAPPSDKATTPQVKKVKPTPTPQVLATPTQPHTSK